MRDPTTFIKLDRNLLSWRWIGDPNTLAVWIWLLLSVNIEPHDFKDQTIGRGEICCSCARIAAELHLSEKNVRTALNHLLKTGEISKKRQIGKTPIITIEGFSRYQGKPADSWQIAGRYRADSRQIDGEYPAEIKEYKNIKNDNNDKKGENAREEKSSNSDFVRPSAEEVAEFCRKNKLNVDAQRFVDYYTGNGWTVGGAPIIDWQAVARNWSRREKSTPAKATPAMASSFDPDEFFKASLMARGMTEEDAQRAIEEEKRGRTNK